MKEHVQSARFQSGQSARSQILGCMHDDFYVMHTRADPCGHADAESMDQALAEAHANVN